MARLPILIVVMLSGVMASAHQQKEAYTTVLFNERTGNLEIAHQFLLHDAEHAFARLINSDADILLNRRTQAEFANYIYEKFQLNDATGAPIVLKPVGFEVEGKYIWIYQEARLREIGSGLAVHMDALQEVWPEQINQINVERHGHIRSARLKQNDGWQTISLND